MSLISSEIREAVVLRAGNRCEYCRLSQESQVATFPVDHIIPTVLEGKTTLENLALACPRCNSKKWIHAAADDPVSGKTIPLFNPRTQVWSEHFRWSVANPIILQPITPTGMATAVMLDLNSSQHVTIRQWLSQLGLHPPP